MPIQPPIIVAPRLVYVSTSGSDSNDGLSPATPKATIAAGTALIRGASSDQLLLKRGDTWTETFGTWSLSGARLASPIVIGAYGSGARPIVRTGTGHGFATTAEVNFITIRDIDFYAHSYTGANGTPSGIRIGAKAKGISILYCLIRNFRRGIDLDATTGAFTIIEQCSVYRNVIVDCYATGGGTAYAIYGYKLFRCAITENIVDAIGLVAPSATQHGIYIPQISTASALSYGNDVRDNFISDCSSCGVKAADGWDTGSSISTSTYIGNVVAKCSVGMWFGDAASTSATGFDLSLGGNVIIAGLDNDGASARGWGMAFENVSKMSSSQDVILNVGAATDPHPIIIHPRYPSVHGIGVRNAVFNNLRVYGWNGTWLINGTTSQLQSDSIDNCYLNFEAYSQACIEHVPDNTLRWFGAVNHIKSGAAAGSQFLVNAVGKTLAQWKALVADTTSDATLPTWPDPTRSIASYDTLLGGAGTHANFVAECRLQSSTYWRPQYTAQALALYLRQGVGLS